MFDYATCHRDLLLLEVRIRLGRVQYEGFVLRVADAKTLNTYQHSGIAVRCQQKIFDI